MEAGARMGPVEEELKEELSPEKDLFIFRREKTIERELPLKRTGRRAPIDHTFQKKKEEFMSKNSKGGKEEEFILLI